MADIHGLSANWITPFHVLVRRKSDGHTSFYSGHEHKGDADNVATQANVKAGDENEAGFPAGFEYVVAENTHYAEQVAALESGNVDNV